MPRKHIEPAWESYRDMVVPKDASETQVYECRQAFFAGAASLFYGILLALDEDSDPTEADIQRMDDVKTELDEFGQGLDLRYLEPMSSRVS